RPRGNCEVKMAEWNAERTTALAQGNQRCRPLRKEPTRACILCRVRRGIPKREAARPHADLPSQAAAGVNRLPYFHQPATPANSRPARPSTSADGSGVSCGGGGGGGGGGGLTTGSERTSTLALMLPALLTPGGPGGE